MKINILTLKMLKINNLYFSGKKINHLTFTFLELGQKCQFFKKKIGSLRSQWLDVQINFRLASLALNSKTMVYTYSTFNTYTYNASLNIYHYILYISIQIYGQPILLLWHNNQTYVPIEIAKNGTILYENYYKLSRAGLPESPSITILLVKNIMCVCSDICKSRVGSSDFFKS